MHILQHLHTIPFARKFDADDTLNASPPSKACSWASAECGFAERLNSESESVNKAHGNQLYWVYFPVRALILAVRPLAT